MSALGRLLLRPYLLWHAVPVGGLTLIFWWLAAISRGWLRDPADAAAAELSRAELALALGAVLFPMAFAAWIGWAFYELLLCSFAPLLPALRARLFGGLVLSALLVSALSTWWCLENPGEQSAPPFFALAFLCQALGILWADPGFATWGHARWLLQIVALAPIFLAPEIVRAFEAAPFALTPLALAAGAVILRLPFRRAAMRARALDPACAQLIQPASAAQRVAWHPGRTLARSADWTRAALHEAFGHARGGWVGALIASALWYGAILVGLGWVLEALGAQERVPAADSVYAFLVGAPRRSAHGRLLLSWALPIWATFNLLAPVRLGGAGFCPLSRARRAEVAWRANLLLAAGVVISFGVVLTAASEIAFAFSGRAARTHDVPEFMHVLLSTLVCAPVAFVARLRWLDRWKPMRAYDAGLLGLLALVLALPAVGLSSLWREAFRRWDAPAWLALMFFLAVVSMGLWRAFVVRHFATRDLPA